MKKNIYFNEIYGHRNLLREIIYGLITGLSNYPSLIVYAVFRRNMGERFYTLASALGFGIVLLLPGLSALFGNRLPWFDVTEYFNWFWVLFSLAFIGVAIMRRLEFSRRGHTFDTERFSYSEGEQMSFWNDLHVTLPFMGFDKRYNVSKYYEPLTVFLTGILFAVLPFTGVTGQFLMITALLHYGRVHVQWQRGREFILDRLDNVITGKEMANSFMDDNYVSKTGFGMNCPRPKDMNLRQQIIDQINDENSVTE